MSHIPEPKDPPVLLDDSHGEDLARAIRRGLAPGAAQPPNEQDIELDEIIEQIRLESES